MVPTSSPLPLYSIPSPCMRVAMPAGPCPPQARLVYAQPTAGLAEIEPSMEWNPSVVSGVGVVSDVKRLYSDMHSYLASSGSPLPVR